MSPLFPADLIPQISKVSILQPVVYDSYAKHDRFNCCHSLFSLRPVSIFSRTIKTLHFRIPHVSSGTLVAPYHS
jgi:hypothetical protein